MGSLFCVFAQSYKHAILNEMGENSIKKGSSNDCWVVKKWSISDKDY